MFSTCVCIYIYLRAWVVKLFPGLGPEQHGVYAAIDGRYEQHERRNCACRLSGIQGYPTFHCRPGDFYQHIERCPVCSKVSMILSSRKVRGRIADKMTEDGLVAGCMQESKNELLSIIVSFLQWCINCDDRPTTRAP